MIEQANFTSYYLRKALEKQIKTIEDQEEKTSWSLKIFKSWYSDTIWHNKIFF